MSTFANDIGGFCPDAPVNDLRHHSATMTRAPVYVAMLPELGHLLPTFKLMRSLVQRGHDVRYLVPRQLAEPVEAQGFTTVPFLPQLANGDEPGGNFFAKRQTITRRFLRTLECLANSDADVFGPVPGLVLADVTQPHVAMWARACRLPLLLLNTSLPQTRDPAVPPLRSGQSYDASLLGRVKSGWAWERFLFKRRASAGAAELLAMCPPYEVARRLSFRFGVEVSDIDSDTVYMPQLKGVDELVFCPREFDFPRPDTGRRTYVESLDVERSEAPFSAENLRADKPIIYCSLGGQLYRAGDTPSFLRRVVELFRKRQDWQLIIATGKHLSIEQLGPLPANVLAMVRAPQLSVLARASLMITHGGLGSVKECIAHGVPMLVFPLDVDQPGNAARVAYHGLGLSGDVASTRGAALAAMIERVLRDGSYKQRVLAMREHLMRLERTQPGLHAIEAKLNALNSSQATADV